MKYVLATLAVISLGCAANASEKAVSKRFEVRAQQSFHRILRVIRDTRSGTCFIAYGDDIEVVSGDICN